MSCKIIIHPHGKTKTIQNSWYKSYFLSERIIKIYAKSLEGHFVVCHDKLS